MTRRLLATIFSVTAAVCFVPAHGAVPQVMVAAAYTFVPGDVDEPSLPLRVWQGDSLTFLNLDVLDAHDVTSYGVDANGDPLFQSGSVNASSAAPVTGVEALPPGEYPFFCEVHGPVMEGVLVIEPALA